MNVFERNFWSLYQEFLEVFKTVEYRGFSIPYLCHFRSLIRDNVYVKTNLTSEKFSDHLSHHTKDKPSFQKLFTDYKKSHTSHKKRNNNGKVALYNAANLLRFPSDIILKHFKPEDTFVIRDVRGKGKKVAKAKTKEGLTASYLIDYLEDVDKDVLVLQKMAENIISKHKDHPMFNDPTFKIAFDRQINGIVRRIVESKNFLRKVPVSCIVFSSTHYYQSRTIAMVAAEENIPTICMQHGMVASEMGYLPKVADVDAVYGQFEVNWFKKMGVSEQAVDIVGHPRFDIINRKPSFTREKLYKDLGLDIRKKTILVIVRGQAYVKKWGLMVQALHQLGDYNIIIKDFPASKPHELTTKYTYTSSSKQYHLYDLLPYSDAVVAYISTVGLEAMIANKPVFILSTTTPTYTGYYDQLEELVQKDPAKLAEVVHRYFQKRSLQKRVVLKRNEFMATAYPIKKSSAETLKDLITRLTKS
ncbi:hypothetical protein [Halobacillus sp. H74]|uniref:hypothetical protein n=1 Tax=Halobacillus sp. H74 TaxID=3457436 RepID=UPI003FCE4FFD